MNIGGVSHSFRPFGQPTIRPAILWTRDAAGYPMGSDRGAAQDVYEARVTFADTEANLDTLQQTLNANREGVTLSSFSTTGQEIFGPEVNYSGSISATVVDFGEREHIHFNKVSQLQVTFRALSPTLLGTTASLASLRLQEGFTGDQSWDVAKSFTYSQAAAYKDGRADVGRLSGTFIQKPAEARAILAYLLTTARATAVTLPTFPGLTYPFGRPKGSGPFNCKITKFEVSRLNLNRWTFKIDFEEAP